VLARERDAEDAGKEIDDGPPGSHAETGEHGRPQRGGESVTGSDQCFQALWTQVLEAGAVVCDGA
jgi:hypothetical protein